jgi:hypothetical protein
MSVRNDHELPRSQADARCVWANPRHTLVRVSNFAQMRLLRLA